MKLGSKVKIKVGDEARRYLLNVSFYDPEEIDRLPGLVGDVVGFHPRYSDVVKVSWPEFPSVYKQLYVSTKHLIPAQ